MNEGILERIISLLSAKGIDQKEVIAYLNLPRGTFSNWVRKKSHSYYEYITEIADFLGVSSEYLITGKDDAYMNETMSCLSKDDIEMLRLFHELKPAAKKTVKDMIALVHG